MNVIYRCTIIHMKASGPSGKKSLWFYYAIQLQGTFSFERECWWAQVKYLFLFFIVQTQNY